MKEKFTCFILQTCFVMLDLLTLNYTTLVFCDCSSFDFPFRSKFRKTLFFSSFVRCSPKKLMLKLLIACAGLSRTIYELGNALFNTVKLGKHRNCFQHHKFSLINWQKSALALLWCTTDGFLTMAKLILVKNSRDLPEKHVELFIPTSETNFP